MKNWYSIKAKDETAEISIFDEIGYWGITAENFRKDFDTIKDKKNINIMLNSPGGSVFDGMAIYNIIAGVRAKVSIQVYGLAASIASIIALSGNSLIMAEGTYLMIHDPWGMAIGNADDMIKTADLLDKMKGEFINIYENNSNLETDEIATAMTDETWYTAAEALEAGFIDEIAEQPEKLAAKFDLTKYKYAHCPVEMTEKTTEKPANIRELEAVLRDAGYSKKESKTIAAHGWSRDDIQPMDSEPAHITNLQRLELLELEENYA